MSSLDDQIKACPHCFSRVMVMSDGRCPTCWGDTNLPNASGRHRYRMHGGEPIPQLCVVCGEATRRTVVVTDQLGEEAGIDGDNSALTEILQMILLGWVSMLFLVLMKIFGKAPNTSGHIVREMSLKLPQCRHCRKAPLRSLDANHDTGTMTIAAHERFIEAVEANRG